MARILVVDNEPDIRRLLEFRLIRAGHEVACAEHGDEAFRLLQELLPDLVLLDLEMPVMDGWTFVQELRRDAGYWQVPVVIVSARPDTPSVAHALRAVDYLVKPFSRADLENLLQRTLGG